MTLYSTAPYTDAIKIATGKLYMERWRHPQHDEHVKRFKYFQRIGGFQAYCADFFLRHGYHYHAE